ncbi:hypothetical protein OGAPHI_006870 [Ogataea philodendri]|uniref:Uncharacterized protein n=1 Tax=Ogataea philodendri TaxID=1378263 RepID=A0A9P8NWE9_9ASCO|nr:uncharacterized protein OGAPHI_006870 [Ogataea philodendri]KAH3660284.1 hypothetical protein OGAPHI_006870 [Ogataea philodendri]
MSIASWLNPRSIDESRYSTSDPTSSYGFLSRNTPSITETSAARATRIRFSREWSSSLMNLEIALVTRPASSVCPARVCTELKNSLALDSSSVTNSGFASIRMDRNGERSAGTIFSSSLVTSSHSTSDFRSRDLTSSWPLIVSKTLVNVSLRFC